MPTYELAQLISHRESSNNAYLEFLKVPDLSMGLYILPANRTGSQNMRRKTWTIASVQLKKS
ncbi:MAG: hypothetical protein LC108_08345 [Anaerolineales bacterium]|nr:hypothetical protein [Anaerolineales bacterium]